ncbi:hypothetical protein Belba_2995 [Belliella baltica DSM 15883]|uniref:Uncharacterized protein n=1 Tax=Belliella baltica (strain DSM 15883 / CIP 108006 / LMG 21964 / BA134) TaxID=866536 RepID=I3Z8E6_BELBD|nr:hypothetical protein Belba_2995 [Belliella baltica DSM 15883]
MQLIGAFFVNLHGTSYLVLGTLYFLQNQTSFTHLKPTLEVPEYTSCPLLALGR